MTKMYVESADLTAVANAIRSKTEGTSPLEFPADFVSEIDGISGGAEITDAWRFFSAGHRLDMIPDIYASFKNVQNFAYLFADSFNTSSTPKTISTTGIDWSHAYNLGLMFENDSYIEQIDMSMMNKQPASSGDPWYITSFYETFKNLSRLKRLAIGFFGGHAVDTDRVFYNDSALEELIILDTNAILAATGSSFADSSGISAGTCQIYVPDSLVSTYKAATNWNQYSGQIHGLSDYPGTPWWDAANQ